MNLEIAYQEALDYLYRFIDYGVTRTYRNPSEDLSLTRMEEFLGRLGNPQNQYPTIHVAGTKGKGSVSSLIARTYQEAGYRTGLYTSPHLQEYTERIRINDEMIRPEELVSLVNEIRPVIDTLAGVTTFEITTVLGFLYFARKKVDLAIIEVGLGGRVDATNVIIPMVSVITSLSMDHMHILGDTLEKITAEKAGIIKKGVPVVSAPQKDEALKVLQQKSTERNSPLYVVGDDLRYRCESRSLDKQKVEFWSLQDQVRMDNYLDPIDPSDWKPTQIDLPLLGFHQVINAATAYLTIQKVNREGISVNLDDIRRGFGSVQWPGRFEILNRRPMLVTDSAHNQESALKLRQALDDYFPGKPVILVFGASEDKDLPGIFSELGPRVERVIATQSPHPRALNTQRIIDLAHQFGCHAQAILPMKQALIRSLEMAGHQKVVLVTGSLFVASAAKDIWVHEIADSFQEKHNQE